MTKKFVVLFLMLLLPVLIWAQNSVTFDFSSSSPDAVVPTIMEKNGVYLKFSATEAGIQPNYLQKGKVSYLKLRFKGLLTIGGEACTIKSVKLVSLDSKHRLKVYNGDMLSFHKFGKINYGLYEHEWTGSTQNISFCAFGGYDMLIKSIVVTFNKGVSLAVSSAERATLYYSDRSFIIPEGVVARTYKIEGNVLSRSREYKKGDVLPKGTAVVLEAKEGKYIFEETSKTGETDSYNALHGSDSTTITSGGEVYYVFGKGSNGIGFYWKEANGKAFTTEAHKAYLVYTPSKTTNAKSFFGFDVALEIQGPMVREKTTFDGPIYNLSGQRVDKDYKGIIIVNGKKYLNR
mgnify:FL=1